MNQKLCAHFTSFNKFLEFLISFFNLGLKTLNREGGLRRGKRGGGGEGGRKERGRGGREGERGKKLRIKCLRREGGRADWGVRDITHICKKGGGGEGEGGGGGGLRSC